MPLPRVIDIAKDYLFASVDEMNEANIPLITQGRLIRLRDLYNFWLQYPRMKDLEIVQEDMKRYKVQKSAAYEDLRYIKYLLGDLNKASKDYHRYRFTVRNEESRETAKRLGDARAMAACDNYYGKYMQLDKEDEIDKGYDTSVVQPFVPSADPTVLGIKPIPDIRERIKKKISQYWSEDVEEVDFEDADFDEDAIFHPELGSKGKVEE